ncbi:hypothetical protein [Paenibacillus sp. HJGM_3]|uniref:hypothetical protein n=1 Tax=Paenibacillus sp. HJGM_3 TaxID=3379816 RepID=UPI0038582AB3
MEKYFIVTEHSPLHQHWFAYKENSKLVRDFVKKFTSENGIESDEYYAADDALYIVPSGNDAENFKNILGAQHDNGLRKIKSTSKIGKTWVKSLKESGLEVKRKPMVIMYCKVMGGRYRSRLFDQNRILYCSIDPAPEVTPTGFVEMKASEFFKIIEDSESVPA